MMIGKRATLFLVAVFVAIAAWSGPRDPQEMRRAAAHVLARSGMIKEKGASNIRMMEKRRGMCVMGNDSAFAILAADDACPAVLAYSPTPFEAAVANPHFNWWLRMTEQALSDMDGSAWGIPQPKAMKYASHVDPLITTQWGQGFPYNMYCPNGLPTGCVSTATSQVLKYNEWPQKGQGSVFIYVPFGDLDGIRYEEELGGNEYLYANMADSYWNSFSNTEGQEVAQLMYHVGLAVKSNYAKGGTGSYSETLCHGLRNNLGYPYAVTLKRESFTSEEWMDMVYASLNEGKPIIYGGCDDDYSGHEFVLDGYDEDGKIHINWGWDGSGDGFYDLEPLIFRYYDFSYYQDMVARCSTDCLSADTVVVDMTVAGMLSDWPGLSDGVVCLKVRGPINGTDLRTIRALAGSDDSGHGTRGQLSVLDLSEATIVAGGDGYLTEDGKPLTTSDGVLPYKAFSNCHMLIDVTLPEGLKSYGGAVFAECNNLDRVVLHPGEGSDFIVEGGLVLSSDRTRLIECLPDGTGATQYVIPDGVVEVCPHAFNGRFLYERLIIPESVDRIGAFAFNRCYNLVRTYVFDNVPPVIDSTAIDLLDISLRKLYVPMGCTFRYATTDGWDQYRGFIEEFHKTDVREILAMGRDTHNAVYDLQGRIVERGLPHSPGIYVTGGKSIIVR